MKVLIMSDTHHYLEGASHAIAYARVCGATTLIHCGDHIQDAYQLQEKHPDFKVYAVPGNCDWESTEERIKIIDMEGIKCLITHGDRHHVKYTYEELYIDAQACDAKLVLFGHSHIAYKESKEGISIVNPGSISEPRDTRFPSFAIVDLQNGRIESIDLLQIQGNERIIKHPHHV